MKMLIEKEIKNLYYLKVRWGDLYSWGSQKSFVRIPYTKKDGTLGSKMYCTSADRSILFDSFESAKKMRECYNCCDERIGVLKFSKYVRSNKLKEIEINGIKCYILD